jgi:predicted RND superfamily exporter protein
MLFFGLTVLATMLALWWYLGSFRLALLPLCCSVVAVIWEFGLLQTFGYGVDPFAIMVPFLVLAVSTSHGVQYVNTWADEVVQGRNGFEASRSTFRRLFIPGSIALLTNVAGFLTIYLVPIGSVRDMSINACFGMFAVIVTNKVMMPIWLSKLSVANVDAFRRKRLAKISAATDSGMRCPSSPRSRWRRRWCCCRCWCSAAPGRSSPSASSAMPPPACRSCGRTRATTATSLPSPATFPSAPTSSS